MQLHRRASKCANHLQQYIMAQPKPSYASFFSGPSTQSKQVSHQPIQPSTDAANSRMQQGPSHGHSSRSEPKRSTSPHYTPKTASPEKNVYVLTLLTDQKHHQTLTKMRKQYFPPRLNRLDAHLTLFHALPGSELETAIRPKLSEIAQSTSPFSILAATPFRLNKGIAIGLPKAKGGDDARNVHTQLKGAWKDFLSRQDSGGFAAHYTIMNKMDDESAVQNAFDEVEANWKGCHGTAEGLSLFLYDRGNWVHMEDFRFGSGGSGSSDGQ